MSATTDPVAVLLARYDTAAAYVDEAVERSGRPRAPSAPALAALAGHDLAILRAEIAEEVDERGVCFHSVDGRESFVLDPVPRVVTGREWAALEPGLVQRVRALDAFVADAYAEQAIVREGIVPASAIESCDYFEPALRGHAPPGGAWIGVAGLDLVRDGSGRLLVLEDNLRTPSGLAYTVVARQIMRRWLGDVEPAPRPLDGLVGLMRETIRAAAPADARAAGDVRAALVTDGRDNSAFFEHQWLASHLHLPLVEPGELEVRERRLWIRRRGERDPRPLDVVYRRTNGDRAGDPIGELLLGPWKAGTLGLVNAFGTGIGDDKLLHAYVEEMIRFYLGEEPLLPSVPTYDLSRPEVLARQRPRLGELVVKPRTGHGGIGIVVGPHARAEDVERVGAAVDADPASWVAQELVGLSRHPTAIDGSLVPRHVDLRPFVFSTVDGTRVLPGGLTRVALGEDSIVVNSSQNGGAKDTWVLP